MLKEDQAQQLLSLGAITPEQAAQLTSPDPTQTLAYLPETTPELQNQWDAEKLAQKNIKKETLINPYLKAAVSSIAPGGALIPSAIEALTPERSMTDQDVISAAEEIKNNKSLIPKQPSPQDMRSMLEIKKRDAGLPFDQTKISQPIQLVTDIIPETPTKTKDPLAGIYSAFDKEQKANLELAKTAEKQAIAESTYMDTMAKEQERLMEENQAREFTRQQKLDQQMSLLTQKLDQYDKSPANVGQMFANKTTGGKILGAIALFLGSAPDGTAQNSALQVMQASLDADLNKQRAGISGARGAYNDLLSTFGDQRQADAGARLAYLNNAQLKLNQIASQYKGEMVQKNAQLLNSKIEQQKEAVKMQFAQASGPKVASADQTTQLIYANVPKELQSKAIEESGYLEELELDKKTIKDAFQKIRATSFAGNFNPLSASETAEDAGKAIILPTVMKVLASRGMTNPDVMKGLKQLKPTELNTDAQIDAKEAQVLAIIDSAAKPTPILTRFGAKPKNVEQTFDYTQRKK